MHKTLLLACSTALAALLLFGAASASASTFSNTSPIAVPAGAGPTGTSGPASPYPSSIAVSGERGPVVEGSLAVTLNHVSHTFPEDLDILLVGPNGEGAIVMSDACGPTDVVDRTWTIGSSTQPEMTATPCDASAYSATDLSFGAPDGWVGAPSGPYGPFRDLGQRMVDPNGTWSLYVLDDAGDDWGQIAGGWSLSFDTLPVPAYVPGAGSKGPADPYPLTQTVSGQTGVITDVNATIGNIGHRRPDDLDLLLVGPHGQSAMLMSDACGAFDLVHTALSFDDEAGAPLGDNSACPSGSYKPVDYESGDRLPAPAPDGPYGTALSEFDGTEPNGDWKLYAYDDTTGEEGWIAGQPSLNIDTRPKATVAFAEGAATVTEGTTRTVTLTRASLSTVGPATVTVTSTPGSATSGVDYTPISTTVEFGRGEGEKTVPITALTDGQAEPGETFSVVLSNPTGDATVGTRARVDVTIPASAADPKPVAASPQSASDHAGPATATAPGTATSAGAPKLSAAAIKRRGKRLTLEFTLDADASVQAAISQKVKRGRRAAVVVRRRQTIRGKAGRNRVALSTKRLRRGRYALELVAAAGGKSSAPTKLGFASRGPTAKRSRRSSA